LLSTNENVDEPYPDWKGKKVMSNPYEVEIEEDLWNSFQKVCDQDGVDPHTEIKQTIENYIVSVQEESEL